MKQSMRPNSALSRRARSDERPKVRASGRSNRSVELGGIAAALGGAAAYNIWSARKAEREHPPTGRFIEVDGVRLHYIERGQGQPLVLMHGNGGSIEEMEVSGLVADAAERYCVILFDRPGYGHSTRPRGKQWTPEAQAALFWKALRQLDVERPLLLGHSWGTLVAISMALHHPREVAGLVLLAGYYFPTVHGDSIFLSPPAIPVVGDAMRYTVSPLLSRMIMPLLVRRVFAPSKVPAKFRNYPFDLAVRPSQIKASAEEAAMMIPAAARLSQFYGRLDLPTMIVAGDGDTMAKPENHSIPLHQAIPNSELRLIPGIGHMLHHVAPGAVLNAIADLGDRTHPAMPSAMAQSAETRVSTASNSHVL